ncbi:hypothetical protein N9D31_01435 [Oligoflexaceae bacterium]|nr:hypothetical protein [Oligoflexaceae bacterium]
MLNLINSGLALLTFFAAFSELHSLPIGFGHNQGSLEYSELDSSNFIIYHDKRTPNEARLTLNSLEVAKPILEKWMAIRRENPLPIIMTAEAAGASFANFITDTIELQTAGQGTRDLAWHELTHSVMYEHLHNILGPAGAILHLAWMPSWFLEGLAESTSISIDSAIQIGFERYLALSGRWPTYESLHSLYSGHTDSYLGYAVSGAFVSYLIRRANLGPNLPGLLNEFYFNSMPWMWPWALTPFSPFLPLDDALEEYAKLNGKELYEQYKTASRKHWEAQKPGPFLYETPGSKYDVSHLKQLHVRNGKIYSTVYTDGELYLTEVRFDKKTGWYSGYKKKKRFVDEAEYHHFTKFKRRTFYSRPFGDKERNIGFEIFRKPKGKMTTVIRQNGRLVRLFETAKSLAYIVHSGETFRFCSVRKSLLRIRNKLPINATICPLEMEQPRLVTVIGQDTSKKDPFVETIYLRIQRQSLLGDEHSVLTWSPDRSNKEISIFEFKEKPISVNSYNGEIWSVFQGTSFHSIRKYDSNFASCLGQLNVSDLISNIVATADDMVVLKFLHGSRDNLLQIDKNKLQLGACNDIGQHSSPLLWASRQKTTPDLTTAFKETDFWRHPIQVNEATSNEKNTLPEITDAPKRQDKATADPSVPASFRLRPVFAVPWVGGDSGGSSFGLLSIPLMDHMQNFTAQLTALYGTESRFPTTQLSTYYTGFWPKISFDAFRYQTWNGVFVESDESPLRSAYLDERGARLSFDFRHFAWKANFSLGLKSAELSSYVGPTGRIGTLNELHYSASKTIRLGSWNWSHSLSGANASESINENFDYNKLLYSTNILRRFSLWNKTHRIGFGYQYGRTRGKKMRRLRESYRPLRIYIPDGGGGLNNISIPIVSGGGLFSATFGDTTTRAKIDYSFPLISNLDTLVRLFYIHELKFSAFVNYGGAWYQESWPSDVNRLIGAHGYALDLLFDLKGINFNLGGGTGQVFGEGVEVYFTFGFDQIF